MSQTVLLHRPVLPRRITVAAVRAALEDVVAANPGKAGHPLRDDQPSRYIEQGQPSCLISLVMLRLGFSKGVLRALDEEHPTGEILQTGVTIEESRHPALKKITEDARRLLQYVQEAQDRGVRWDRIVTDAFRRQRWFRVGKKPWLR